MSEVTDVADVRNINPGSRDVGRDQTPRQRRISNVFVTFDLRHLTFKIAIADPRRRSFQPVQRTRSRLRAQTHRTGCIVLF